MRAHRNQLQMTKLCLASLCMAGLIACQGNGPGSEKVCIYPESWVFDPAPGNKVIAIIKPQARQFSFNGDVIDEAELTNRLRSWADLSPSPLFLVEFSKSDTCANQLKILHIIDAAVTCDNSACGVTFDSRRQRIK